MSELSIEPHWQRFKANLHLVEYSKVHPVRYGDSYELQLDAAPDCGGDPDNINPEQALTAAVSSCRMMTVLL